MDGRFLVRPAATADMDAVASLFREYADTLGVDLSFQGFEAELAGLPGDYSPPVGALLLAVSAVGVPLGCVGVRALPEPGSCEMKRLYVRGIGRRAGIGRVLAVAAIQAAAVAGYVSMRLDTLPGMLAAQALYRDLGFEVTPAYYDSPVPGTIFMRRTLGPPEA